MTETDAAAPARVRAVIDSVDAGRIVLALAHTDYRVQLALEIPNGGALTVPPGKRVTGVAEAKAMRFHAASGGGRFIEPVYGEPRIVAGTVKQVDREGRRVLIDVAMPLWIACTDDQDMDVFVEGALVTGYLHSGTRFTPDESCTSAPASD